MERHLTRTVQIGTVAIGGGQPVAIQSMTNTKTEDAEATVRQILALEEAGCEIVRVTVPSKEAALALPAIKEKIHIPLVADIHFDYRLAIAAMDNGADKVRINPGNIGSEAGVRAVVERAAKDGIPLRVGVNSGSLEKKYLEKYGGVTPEALVESALGQAALIEAFGYDRLVISIKSSRVPVSIRAHELLAERCDYPVHVGITEAGTRDRQIRSGDRSDPLPRHRGYDPCFPDRRPGGGGPRGPADLKEPGPSDRRDGDHFLPDLRPDQHRPDRAGRAGGEDGVPL